MSWKPAVAVVCLSAAMGAAQPPAQVAAQPAPMRFGVVSFTALVMQTREAQQQFGDLQSRYAPRQAKLQQLNSEIEAARRQLSDPAAKLTDDERAARTQTLSAKEKELERAAEDYRTDTQADSQQTYQKIAEKVFAYLQEYARKNGYTAIIDRGTDATPVVWYTADGIDITAGVAKAYDSREGKD